MKKLKIETAEEGFDLAAWVRKMSSGEVTVEKAPPGPSAEKNTVPKRPRRSTPLIEAALVPRWKWSKAHRALIASGEPHESTAEDAGVLTQHHHAELAPADVDTSPPPAPPKPAPPTNAAAMREAARLLAEMTTGARGILVTYVAVGEPVHLPDPPADRLLPEVEP